MIHAVLKRLTIRQAHLIVIFGALLWESLAYATAPSATKHRVTLEDLESLREVSDLQLAPNGKVLAYVIGKPMYSGEIWISATEPGSVPRKIAMGDFPHFSPDGRRLAYYSRKSKTLQLWILDLQNGGQEQVTHLVNGIDPDPWTQTGWINDAFSYSWSPDGSELVFASRVNARPARHSADNNENGPSRPPWAPLILNSSTPPNWTLSGIFTSGFGGLQYKNGQRSHEPDNLKPRLPRINQLFIANIKTHLVRQITHDENIYFHPNWSPDGRRIVCASSEGQSMEGGAVQTTNIHLIDVRTGQKQALTYGPEDKWQPYWSPDGRYVAFLGGKNYGIMSVFIVPATGGNTINVMSNVDRRVLGFRWLNDGASIIAFYQDGIDWPIVEVNISIRDIRILDSEKNIVRSFLSTSNSGDVAWLQSDPRGTGLIRILRAGAHSPYTVVRTNPQIDRWELGEQKVIRWKNHRGEEMEGILILPVGYLEGQEVPLIVDCYPLQANGFKGWAMMGNQGWAGRGYAVFWPNPRAPHAWLNSFKSEAYDQAAKGPQGWDITFDDVNSGVDELIRRKLVDPDRIGLYGFSNGGGVVNYLVTRTHRFRCAVSVAGALSDWIRPALLQPSSWIQSYETDSLNPWDDPDSLIALSAVFHTNHVTTPMLLADGDEDGNFLLDAIEMYNGLRRFGQDVTLLRYPHQQHGFTDAALRDFWRRENAFFDLHLKP